MSEHIAPERIVAYVDGELAGDERTAVERHLEACGRCRSEAEHLRELDEKVMRAGESAGQQSDSTLAPALQAELEATARRLLASRATGAVGPEVGAPSTSPSEPRLRRLVLRM